MSADPISEERRNAALSQGAAKVDPETLAIRARPGRAIRIKRGAVIALSAVGFAFVLFSAWAALRHGGFRPGAPSEAPSLAGANPAGDSLNGLAKSYADVPRLGPPMQGDIGKAMVDQQQRSLMAYCSDTRVLP